MLSWIFRHRQRLAAIYGQAQACLPQRAEPARAPAVRGVAGLAPGGLSRKGARVELRPMPPRAR